MCGSIVLNGRIGRVRGTCDVLPVRLCGNDFICHGISDAGVNARRRCGDAIVYELIRSLVGTEKLAVV